ncbi:MAG: hypothetical protein AB7K24_22550 [Gemmataceae bacterium]
MGNSPLSSTDHFDEQYPETLPDRLEWLEKHVHANKRRILGLMQLSEAEQSRLHDRPWREITESHSSQADRAEHLLTHYLSFFDYDAGKAAAFAKEFVSNEESEQQLMVYLPALTEARTAAEQDKLLIQAAHEEGPSLLPVLAKLLGSEPPKGKRRS